VNRMSQIAAVSSFLLLVGCAVGPNYKRPRLGGVSVPKQWTVAPATEQYA
jgi:hypothetical protein